MKFLLKIEDQDLGLEITSNDLKENLRISARAVIFNDKNEIALQYISRDGYYKLPGGGIEEGETVEQGLRREIVEEVGCEIDILKDLGFIVEYRNQKSLLQISYCYLVQVKGTLKNPSYDQSEIEEGMQSMWISFQEAFKLLKQGTNHYSGKFITKRDGRILEEVDRLRKLL